MFACSTTRITGVVDWVHCIYITLGSTLQSILPWYESLLLRTQAISQRSVVLISNSKLIFNGKPWFRAHLLTNWDIYGIAFSAKAPISQTIYELIIHISWENIHYCYMKNYNEIMLQFSTCHESWVMTSTFFYIFGLQEKKNKEKNLWNFRDDLINCLWNMLQGSGPWFNIKMLSFQ